MKSTETTKQNLPYKSRKPYQKPTIERVNLVPSETLSSGCKTISGGSLASWFSVYSGPLCR